MIILILNLLTLDGGTRQKSCYSFDTNDTEASWEQMPVSCMSSIYSICNARVSRTCPRAAPTTS